MEADSKIQISELRVDGGATANNLLMQFQSDILDADVICPHQLETTALGAAYLAGLQVGFWDSIQEIETIWRKDRAFNPKKSSQERNTLLAGWQRAVYSTQAWASYPQNNYKKHV
jgi:glycerol kinase